MRGKTLLEIFEGRPRLDQITIETAAEYIDDECVVYEAPALPFGGVWKGPEGFVGLMAEVRRILPNMSFVREAIIADEYRQQLAFKGRLSFRTSRGVFETRIVEYWTFRNGKAVEILPVWHDVHGVLQMLAGEGADRI